MRKRCAISRMSRLAATFIAVWSVLFCGDALSDSKKAFDHSVTGFELIGAHSVAACEGCHVDGQFDGAPRQCVSCHSLNGRFNVTPKPPNHIQSTQQCEFCHQPVLWQSVTVVDHSQVFGMCNQCHNNLTAPGQPVDHLPTNNDCALCHSDIGWLPALMSHEGTSSLCGSCHNNVDVEGKPADHINASTQCEACHTNTISWAPVVAVDHDEVIGPCFSCHIDDQQDDHISALNQCDGCHTNTISWAPVAVVDHDLVIGTCSSCHNGVTAKGQESHPTGHMVTGPLECDTCHSTITFVRGPL